MNKLLRSLKAKISTNAINVRTEVLRGQEFLVTPAVILVEGVLQGATAETPELALEEEFGRNPASWNGRPVSVSHPQRDGSFVSANAPDMWDHVVVGMLFNTRTENKKLITEIWANKGWLEESNYTELASSLENGMTLEVSTGLYVDLEMSPGIWNGEKYGAIWRNTSPDHLAILPPGTIGACSVADGCGTARNNNRLSVLQDISQTASPTFATSKTEGCCMADTDHKNAAGPGIFARMMNFVASLPKGLQGNQKDTSWGPDRVNDMRSNAAGMSMSDLYTAVSQALAVASDDSYCYIVELYDDCVVYESYQDGMWSLFQRNYSIDGTAIVISSESIQVRPVTSFVPITVTVNAEDETKTETETETVEVVDTTETTETTETVETVETTEVVETLEAAAVVTTEAHTPTVLEMFGATEQDVKEALAIRQEVRANQVKQILSNKQNAFTQEELVGMSSEQLTKMVQLAANQNVGTSSAPAQAQAVDFSIQGSPLNIQREADSNVVAPVLVFPRRA